MFCKECGAEIDSTTGKCPSCGAAAEAAKPVEEMVFCSNCGQKISKKAIVCPHCGAGTEEYRKNQAQAVAQPTINITNTNTNSNTNVNGGGPAYVHKKKWTAFFLCFFLGYLGVHRFYVGKSGTGLLYLFTFGLFGVGCLLDLLLILVGAFKDKMGQPLV